MIDGELETGERAVSADTVAKWGIAVPDGWTVTVRPDRFDADRTPLDFDPGTYSAHDYKAFLDKELSFVVMVAEVFEDGASLAQIEVTGIEWRHGASKTPLYVGDADVDALLPEADQQMMVGDAVDSAMREVGR
ncbi:hypothetical protein AB5J62_33815 [Amycolatopsis sp. cg5]|uniref:hypothetical protein n=1 Tax=Amycolatopsis sp. cg5 TaxID=3238802 RepID=UPI00352485E6